MSDEELLRKKIIDCGAALEASAKCSVDYFTSRDLRSQSINWGAIREITSIMEKSASEILRLTNLLVK